MCGDLFIELGVKVAWLATGLQDTSAASAAEKGAARGPAHVERTVTYILVLGLQ